MLNISQLARLKTVPIIGPYLHETLIKVVNEVNGIHNQTGSANGSPVSAPPAIAALTISEQNGYATAQINDAEGLVHPNLSLNYFWEIDTSSAFSNPTQVPLGAARGAVFYVGNNTTYHRVFSQFSNSPNKSERVNYGGTTPTAVTGHGSAMALPGGSGGSAGGGGGFGGG